MGEGGTKSRAGMREERQVMFTVLLQCKFSEKKCFSANTIKFMSKFMHKCVQMI